MQGRLVMMPSSSQLLDHQLIFYIMYGLGQFHHRQNKGEERRGEIWKKSNNCLANIEQQLMAKIAKNRLLPHGWKTPVDPPSNSCLTNIYMLTVNKHREKNSRVQRIQKLQVQAVYLIYSDVHIKTKCSPYVSI